MPLMPSRVRWRKVQRGTLRGYAQRGNVVSFGEWGLQALEWAWLDGRQIEAGRVAASRAAPEARVFVRVFPHKPVSKKPLETRMGHGKGAPESWVAVIRPGRILYEMEGVTLEIAKEAFRLAGHKLPVKTKLVGRYGAQGK